MTDQPDNPTGPHIPDISDEDPWGQRAYVEATKRGEAPPAPPSLRSEPTAPVAPTAPAATATLAPNPGGGGAPPDDGDPKSARSGGAGGGRSRTVWDVVGWIGRSLITLGLLILMFVAYQLWGTGIYEAQAQSDLQSQFNKTVQHANATSTSSTSSVTSVPATPNVSTTTVAPPPTPPSGGAVAHIVIPKIGADDFVVEGVGRSDLRKGPGHYPQTPMPGQVGNASIAGHRTTYGAPFNRLAELAVGDKIEITTLTGATYQYSVTEQLIVKPTDTYVLLPTPNPDFDPQHAAGPGNWKDLPTLTLTTCNPEYSAAQRLVIKASLDQAKTPDAPTPIPPPAKATTQKLTVDTGTEGATEGVGPTILWLIIVAIAGALWFLAFRRWRHWYTWFLGAVPFLVLLFFLYTHIEQLLPTNY